MQPELLRNTVRLRRDCKVRKELITAGMLTTWVESLGPEPSLADVRLVAIALLAFSAFLRCDELSKLRGCDIRVTPQSMSVHVTSSKTDQYREGASILVARSGSPTCPVAMVERYLALAGISRDSKLRLFRGIVHAKGGDRLRSSGSLSYTRIRRELLLEKITQLGFDPKLFGLHSLRAGGATAAANAGVADRLFKRHGCWRSETAKDGYVKDDVPSLLSVSQSLDLQCIFFSPPFFVTLVVSLNDCCGRVHRRLTSSDVTRGGTCMQRGGIFWEIYFSVV